MIVRVGDIALDAENQFELDGPSGLVVVCTDQDGNQAQLNGIVGASISEHASSWDPVGIVGLGWARANNTQIPAGAYLEGRSEVMNPPDDDKPKPKVLGAEIRATNLMGVTPPWVPNGFDRATTVWMSSGGPADGSGNTTTGISFTGDGGSKFVHGIGLKANALAPGGIGIRVAAQVNQAAAILQIDGGTWTHGLDLGQSGTASFVNGRAIILPNGDSVFSRNAANTYDFPLIGLAYNNFVWMGQSRNGIGLGGTTGTPNGYSVFGQVGGVNATVDTSVLNVRHVAVEAPDVGPAIGFAGPTNSSTGGAANFAGIHAGKLNATTGNGSGYLRFFVNDNVNGFREALRLTHELALRVPVLAQDPSATPPNGFVFLYLTSAASLRTKDSAGVVRTVTLT